MDIFGIFEIKSYCFDVVICDLLHDVRVIHGLCMLTATSGTIFGIISDARSTANCSFPEKLIFQKRFPDAVRNFPNSFPLLQVKSFILPTMSLAAEKKNVQEYVVNFDAIGE